MLRLETGYQTRCGVFPSESNAMQPQKTPLGCYTFRGGFPHILRLSVSQSTLCPYSYNNCVNDMPGQPEEEDKLKLTNIKQPDNLTMKETSEC